jgi:hypothetical protein
MSRPVEVSVRSLLHMRFCRNKFIFVAIISNDAFDVTSTEVTVHRFCPFTPEFEHDRKHPLIQC